MGREGIEPPQPKAAGLQPAELTTCSTYPLWQRHPGRDCGLEVTRHRIIRTGADDGTRTRNLRFTKPLLYQLSYVGATRRVMPQLTPSAPGNDRAARPDGSSGGDSSRSRLPDPGRLDDGLATRQEFGIGIADDDINRGFGNDREVFRRLSPVAIRVALGNGLEQDDGTSHGRIERPDRALHRNPHQEVAASAHGRAKSLSFAADDDGQRPAQVTLANGQGRIRLRSGDPQSVRVEVGQGSRQIVYRTEQEVLRGTGGRLDRRRRERCLASGREDDAVDARCLRASQQRTDVLRVLERIEDEHERRLSSLLRTRKDVVERGEPAWFDDESHALMSVKAGDRRQRPALDFDDGDAQAGRVQDELLQCASPLRDHQQSMCDPAGREDLLDRPSPSYEFLIGAERLGCRQ